VGGGGGGVGGDGPRSLRGHAVAPERNIYIYIYQLQVKISSL